MPFHDEKTPNFQVNPSRGFFYCFGCGEGGDVITFVEEIDNLTFTETVGPEARVQGVSRRRQGQRSGMVGVGSPTD